MASEWPTVRLGDVTDLLTGFPFKSDAYTENSSAPRLLRGDNVAQGVLRWDSVKRWPKAATGDLQQYWLVQGDVILAMDRPWIEAGLKYAAVRVSDLPALLVQRVARLRGTSAVDTGFLNYVIGSRAFTDHVLAVQTGTTIPHISGGQIKSFEFRLPSVGEQRAIAHILGTLDDKIELNRRMNETLESMVRTLFKSWFVDFDPVRAKAEGRDPGLPQVIADLFPDSFKDSELGETPEGWCVRSIQDVAERVAMGPFGASIKVETFVPVGVPIISGQHRRGFILQNSTFNFITDEHAKRLANANVQRGDVVFTHAGSIGQAAVIPETSRYDRYVLSQRQFYMRCDRSQVSPPFIALYFTSSEGRYRLLANTSSSGVPSIARPVTYLRTIVGSHVIPLTVSHASSRGACARFSDWAVLGA